MSESTQTLAEEIVRISDMNHATEEELAAVDSEVARVAASFAIDEGRVFQLVEMSRHPLTNILQKVDADVRNAFKPEVLIEFVKMERDQEGEWSVMVEELKNRRVKMSLLKKAMEKTRKALDLGDQTGDWRDKLQFNSRSEMVCNHYNCSLILENDPKFEGRFSFDMMRECQTILEEGKWVQMTDEHVTGVIVELNELGLRNLNENTAFKCISSMCLNNPRHELREYLDSLEWDREPRLDDWLITYCRAEAGDNAAYLRSIGASTILSMVARAYRPGSKVDAMMILEGRQGTRKSTAVSILGGAWFSDSMPSITSGKDALQHLAGKWVIEMGELSAMSKAEAGHLKQFLTVTTDKYRKSYGRLDISVPRTCVFIGTTNEFSYLRDDSGARRFWPVKVTGVIDTDGLAADRDQLFAEAVARFKSGEPWWPSMEIESTQAAEEQAARRVVDPWTDYVAVYVRDKEIVKVREILTSEAINMRVSDLDVLSEKRCAGILIGLGWVRTHRRDGWSWVRSTEAAVMTQDDVAYAAPEGDHIPF